MGSDHDDFYAVSNVNKETIEKQLRYLQIDPSIIKKHEYDILRLPETRGYQVNPDDLNTSNCAHFDIIENHQSIKERVLTKTMAMIIKFFGFLSI